MLAFLSIMACGDLVEAELFNAELDNRDLQIGALDERVAALEATVVDQAARIEAQQQTIASQAEALAALETSTTGNDAALAARLDAVELTLDDPTSGMLARVDGLEAGAAVTGAAVAAQGLRLDAAEAELTALDGRVDALEAYDTVLSGRITSANTSIAAIDAALGALEDDVAALDSGSTSAETMWSDEGSGSGNCARANVTASSDRPLYVFATVEASAGMSGGCGSTGYQSCYGSSVPTSSASTSGTVTINAENSAGTWTDATSTSTVDAAAYFPATVYAYYTNYYYSGYLYTSRTWTVPVQAVLEIPAAGDYIIDLDVTGISGTCRLVVLQP